MATNYGRDVSCTTSRKTGRFSSGTRLVAEACFRRLITPRGMLRGGEDEQDYGLDITELFGSSVSRAERAAIPGRIQNELLKDPRVESVEAIVSETLLPGGAIAWEISITGTATEGPFDLQLAVSGVTTQLLGLSGE